MNTDLDDDVFPGDTEEVATGFIQLVDEVALLIRFGYKSSRSSSWESGIQRRLGDDGVDDAADSTSSFSCATAE